MRSLWVCGLALMLTAAASPPPAHRPQPHRHKAIYFNYDVLAAPHDVHALFGWGVRVGSGVAEIDTAARMQGETRGISLAGFAWRAESPSGVLVIGDAQTLRGKYEDPVRFDGVQFAGRNVTYEAGWERTDFGDGAMQLGRFVTEATAQKVINSRLTAQAHLFAGSQTSLIALGAIYRTPYSGLIAFGVAPEQDGALTGFWGYALTSPRWSASLDDRVTQNVQRFSADVRYRIAPGSEVHLRDGYQRQGAARIRALSFGYAQTVNDAELHVDFVRNAGSFSHSAGLATYLSLPMGGRRSITAQSDLSNGAASRTIALKQDAPDDAAGTGYDIEFGESGGSRFQNATFISQTGASTAQLALSRTGGPLSWNAEFSGSLLLLDGKHLAARRQIDANGAFQTLSGRGAASLTLVMRDGSPVPEGSLVRALASDAVWRAGTGGRVTIDDLQPGAQTLIVTLPKGACIASIVMPPLITEPADLGKQICVSAAAPSGKL